MLNKKLEVVTQRKNKLELDLADCRLRISEDEANDEERPPLGEPLQELDNIPLPLQNKKLRSYTPPSKLSKDGRQSLKRRLHEVIDPTLNNFPNSIKRTKLILHYNNGETFDLYWPKGDVDRDGKKVSWSTTSRNIHCSFDDLSTGSRTILRKVLRVKDRSNLSDSWYHEMHMILPEALPPIGHIKKERSAQNDFMQISTINEARNGNGVSRNVRSVIMSVLALPENKKLKENILTSGKVIMRFSGDGRRVTKITCSGVMGTLKLLSENAEDIGMSPMEEHCIYLYEGDESYDYQQKCAINIYEQLKEVCENGIVFDNTNVDVEWYITADWKFTAIILGLSGPCSQYFCAWCECPKERKSDFSVLKWTPRTQERSSLYMGSMGYKKKTLVTADWDNVLVDVLHLFLRVMGKLLNQVVSWTVQQRVQEQLVAEMRRIGVTFRFYSVQGVGCNTSVLKWSDLDGEELKVVLKNLDLTNVLQDMADKSVTQIDALRKPQLIVQLQKHSINTDKLSVAQMKVKLKELIGNSMVSRSETQQTPRVRLSVARLVKLWKEFDSIMEQINSSSDETLETKCRQWAMQFRVVTFDEDVTPYIHALVYHVPQQLIKVRHLKHFCCQGVEKKNHLQNKRYHQGTQKGGRGTLWTKQVMQYENRDMYARLNDYDRTKRHWLSHSNQEEPVYRQIFDENEDL